MTDHALSSAAEPFSEVGGDGSKLQPLDPERASQDLAELLEAASERGFSNLAKRLEKERPYADFLAAAMDLSEYLRGALRRRPGILKRLAGSTVETRLTTIGKHVGGLGRGETMTERAMMAALRQAKVEAHVLIALDDISGGCDAATTVRRLSALADACVGAAIDFLLRDLHDRGKLRLDDRARPGDGCGLIVLGMGKLGGGELNYSSDIDLILFFDPEAAAILDPLEATDLFSKLGRRLVRLLQDRTEDGYVFRTDLRLRPDPGSTPLAIPVEAALNYYESRGQNWERAAMIKARPVAGDIIAGDAFLKELQPFVWRKYMDFAAIADVHSIKRQIHAHKGHGAIAVKGHNVKLGRGGIREIEFFVQTQQLIAGGRAPDLRGRETVSMLAALCEKRWITPEARDALTHRYWYLRRVEHAIQILRDEQTQIVPEDDASFERVARLAGHADGAAFEAELRAALLDVERHYAALFEAGDQLSAGIGNLVFTGDVDDPDTLKTLAGLGFTRPADISKVIRTWHFGRYRATRSAEARERLTELTPALLRAFGETRNGDEALMRFDAFLSGLPAGIQLFSLLHSNPLLLKLLRTIMSAAPRLAQVITRRPHVFDGLLDPSLLSDLPNKAYLSDRLGAFLAREVSYEETLDRLRIFAAEQKFLIGIRLMTAAIDASRAGKAFSDLADLTIGVALRATTAEFERRHGVLPGGKAVILGMGKLGSRELTAGSDVDLILLYDHVADAELSDGAKPLAPSQYFARLTQRLIAAVSAPTTEGVLYELDLRLRPSGKQGPIATHIDSFRKYQREEAWTWEHMALTRARIVAGDVELGATVEKAVAEIIHRPRDNASVVKDAADMRKLLLEQKPARDPWDVKLVDGGLIDLEFLAQVATLTGPAKRSEPRPASTADSLAALDPELALPQQRMDLVEAWKLFQTLTQTIRLCLTGPFEDEAAPTGLVELLVSASGAPNFKTLQAELVETERKTAALCRKLLRRIARGEQKPTVGSAVGGPA